MTTPMPPPFPEAHPAIASRLQSTRLADLAAELLWLGRSTMRAFGFIILAIGGLLGCTPDKYSIDAAERVLSEHFDAIRLGETNAAVARYSPDFFLQPKRSREAQLASMAHLHESGAPEFTIVHRDTRHVAGGLVVSFSCQSRYGARSYQEDFELFRAAGTTNFVITRHDFD